MSWSLIDISVNQGGVQNGKSKETTKFFFFFQVFAYYGCQHMVFICDFLCVLSKFINKIKNLSQTPGEGHTKLDNMWCNAHVNALVRKKQKNILHTL